MIVTAVESDSIASLDALSEVPNHAINSTSYNISGYIFDLLS